jgi:hypothetical protein
MPTDADSTRPVVRAEQEGTDELIALADVEPELTQAQRIAQAAELLRRHAGRLTFRVAGTLRRSQPAASLFVP